MPAVLMVSSVKPVPQNEQKSMYVSEYRSEGEMVMDGAQLGGEAGGGLARQPAQPHGCLHSQRKGSEHIYHSVTSIRSFKVWGIWGFRVSGTCK